MATAKREGWRGGVTNGTLFTGHISRETQLLASTSMLLTWICMVVAVAEVTSYQCSATQPRQTDTAIAESVYLYRDMDGEGGRYLVVVCGQPICSS